MTMTDPVSDLLTRIRNASAARHETVDIPSSKLKLEIARIFKEEGYHFQLSSSLRIISKVLYGFNSGMRREEAL